MWLKIDSYSVGNFLSWPHLESNSRLAFKIRSTFTHASDCQHVTSSSNFKGLQFKKRKIPSSCIHFYPWLTLVLDLYLVQHKLSEPLILVMHFMVIFPLGVELIFLTFHFDEFSCFFLPEKVSLLILKLHVVFVVIYLSSQEVAAPLKWNVNSLGIYLTTKP